MKKVFLFFISVFFFNNLIFAQSAQPQPEQRQHKIVFDFTKSDTASFVTLMRHLESIMEITGNANLEVVCFGPGLDLLVKDKTTVQNKIEELYKLNVIFAACELTMKRRGIAKSRLIAQAITVPAAILEISSKEQDGWSYVKEGY